MLEIQWKRRTPYIAQSEASECALACLAMVANYHGHRIDLGSLRQRYAVSLRGASLAQLMKAAEGLGFNARSLQLELNELDQLALPTILHWNLNHFVVLTRITQGLSGTRYHIHDPATGVMVVSSAELSRHFTGIALELQKAEHFQPKSAVARLRISQLWSSIDGLWSTLRYVILLSVVLQAVSLMAPFYLQIAIDDVLPGQDTDLLNVLALGFIGLALVTFVTSWLRALILVSLSNTLSYQIIVNLFRHLVRLPLPWFEKRHVGDIISRFGSTKPVTDLLSQGMIAAFIDGALAVATLTLMFVYSALLAFIAIGMLTVYVGLRVAFLQTIRLQNLSVITASARENSLFIETIRGIAPIKSFGQEGNRQQLWQRAKVDAVNAQVRLGRLSSGFDAGNQLLTTVERVAFVYIAVKMALGGQFTVGMILAFQAYKEQFVGATFRLIDQVINLNILQMHLGRISDIALSRAELEVPRHPAPVEDGDAPLLELRGVRFSYAAGEPEILKGISIVIREGESITLVGPSGGGKTTLLKIMMGLFQPTHGEVLVHGQPLRSYGIHRWRREIGLVAQDDSLFAGSIADNICFFDTEPDMQRVFDVARITRISSDIEKMPMQYDTLVGDMGSAMSGGQKQRLLLARALYPAPRVLFFDEATAHLDPDTEKAIVTAMAELDVTQVASKHRGAIAPGSGRVFAVANGSLYEMRDVQGASATRATARASTH